MKTLLETEPRSAYIHVPFCVHRCGYCDFTLVARRDDLIDAYLEALAIDLARLERAREVDTLFFGGGTPTHLPRAPIESLAVAGPALVPPTPVPKSVSRPTPPDWTTQKVAVLAEAGVNRVSLGVQSFDTEVLELLERDHRGSDIPAVVERVRRSIPNLGLDLIFGVPGQTLELWRTTLSQHWPWSPRISPPMD